MSIEDPTKLPFEDGDGPDAGKVFVIEDIKAGEEDVNKKGIRVKANKTDPKYYGKYDNKDQSNYWEHHGGDHNRFLPLPLPRPQD